VCVCVCVYIYTYIYIHTYVSIYKRSCSLAREEQHGPAVDVDERLNVKQLSVAQGLVHRLPPSHRPARLRLWHHLVFDLHAYGPKNGAWINTHTPREICVLTHRKGYVYTCIYICTPREMCVLTHIQSHPAIAASSRI